LATEHPRVKSPDHSENRKEKRMKKKIRLFATLLFLSALSVPAFAAPPTPVAGTVMKAAGVKKHGHRNKKGKKEPAPKAAAPTPTPTPKPWWKIW
jgi:hypothetical protein